MSDPNDTRDGLKLTDRATLSLLATLEEGEPVTQRSLAARIGVALGLTNGLLKRAVRKGLVKVQQVPAKRYAYYVTPKGFSEKSRLVAEYLSTSLTFFRQARDEYSGLYEQIQAQGHKRVLLFGAGELAEIAIMSAQEMDVELLAVVQSGCNLENFSGLPVYSTMDGMADDAVDAVVITSSDTPQQAYEDLLEFFPAEQIYAVPLLHISRNGQAVEEGAQ